MFSLQMGYGSRALELLKQYYEMKILNVSEAPQEDVVTEISNIRDEDVNLLEERIGNSLIASRINRSNLLRKYHI